MSQKRSLSKTSRGAQKGIQVSLTLCLCLHWLSTCFSEEQTRRLTAGEWETESGPDEPEEDLAKIPQAHAC